MTMTATAAATATTRSGRPKVPPLDKARIIAEVDQSVEAALADATDDRARLVTLAHLVADAEENLAAPGGERHMYRLAVSLHVHEGARGVWRAIGVSRETFSRNHIAEALDSKHWPESTRAWTPATAERARQRRIPFYKDAARDLPKVAEDVFRDRTMVQRVLPMRNELMRRLSEQGMTRVELADIIGRRPSRVSHIVTGRGR